MYTFCDDVFNSSRRLEPNGNDDSNLELAVVIELVPLRTKTCRPVQK